MNQPLLPVVAVQDERRTVLVDPNEQTALPLLTAVEVVTVDPVTGSRTFTQTSTLLRTIDAVIVADPNTTPLYACHICGRAPFSAEAVRRCNCGRVACTLNCLVADEHGAQCTICATAPLWRRAWNWLKRLH